MGDEQEWCYAKYGEIDPRSGARVLRPMLGEPDGIRGLRATIAEQAERIAELQHDADRQRSIANEHVNDNIAKRIRIAELEAALRSAIKSHDKVPENIPVPKWVEGARAVIGGIKVIDPDARIAELEATVAKAFLRCQALEDAVKPFAIQGVEIESADDIYVYYRNTNGEGIILPSVQISDFSRARDVLCHADPVPGCETSSAEGPHQSGDGEAR